MQKELRGLVFNSNYAKLLRFKHYCGIFASDSFDYFNLVGEVDISKEYYHKCFMYIPIIFHFFIYLMPKTIQIATKNYDMANKFRQNPRRHVCCFDCKMALRSFRFNNGAILPRADYRATIKDITYTGDVT